jgi:hypothetical protein
MGTDVDFLVKLRDAACLIKDACEERLESLAPPGAGPSTSYDLNKIAWQSAEGSKGLYEKTAGDGSSDYKALLEDLKTHKGKMNVAGWFVWLFENGTTIGRKKCVSRLD